MISNKHIIRLMMQYIFQKLFVDVKVDTALLFIISLVRLQIG